MNSNICSICGVDMTVEPHRAMGRRIARYKVTLDSAVHGHDATKWDTREEADAAVASIEAEAGKLNDGVRRVVRVIYRGKVLRRVEIGIGRR